MFEVTDRGNTPREEGKGHLKKLGHNSTMCVMLTDCGRLSPAAL